jgi:photosystem II stability/assembly factor-like uncharacterized protein
MNRAAVSLLPLLIVVFVRDGSYAQNGWYSLNPPPVLSGVSFSDPLTGVAVGGEWMPGQGRAAVGLGGRTSILRTTDGGLTWKEQMNRSTKVLTGITFVDKNNGIAIGGDSGDTCTILHTSDGGISWEEKVIGKNYFLSALSFANSQQGTIVGALNHSDRALILHSTDGGTTWTSAVSGINGRLQSVSFDRSTHGIAVGISSPGPGAIILHTDDGGSTWNPEPGIQGIDLNGVYCTDETTAVAVGSASGIDGQVCAIIRTTDDGASWSRMPCSIAGYLRNVSFFDRNVGVAAGSTENGGALLLRTTDGGKTWAELSLPFAGQLNGVWLCDAENGIAVGNGIIIRCADGGKTIHRWGVSACYGVSFPGPDTGTLVGDGGSILRTTDGGSHWMRQESHTSARLTATCFTDVQTGTAIGDSGIILRTTDGGATWLRQQSGTGAALSGIHFASAGTGTAVGMEYLWSSAAPVILHTTNGGASWNKSVASESLRLSGVYDLDANRGFAVGVCRFGEAPVILGTADGWKSWRYVVPAVNGELQAVSFADSLNGLAVGVWLDSVFHSLILATNNGGASWIERPNDFTDWLTAVSFPNPTVAYAVGYHPLVHAGLARIVRSVDGGVTWSEQSLPVFGGYLNSVSFSDERTGVALGDGVILRTTDGGITWGGNGQDQHSGYPEDLILEQNYPNPFNPGTVIDFQVPESGLVRLVVYDLLGREVTVLVNERKPSGNYHVQFNATGLASGVYFYRIIAGQSVQTRKMIFLR